MILHFVNGWKNKLKEGFETAVKIDGVKSKMLRLVDNNVILIETQSELERILNMAHYDCSHKIYKNKT